MEVQSPIMWDLLRVQEPNGVDKVNDEKAVKELQRALSEGYEPFAVVPSMTRSPLNPNPVVINLIYFKRPTIVKESIDESDRIIK